MCKRGSAGKTNVIRIKDRIRSDLLFIKGVIGIKLGSTEDDVIKNLIMMFKQKKIGIIKRIWLTTYWIRLED